MSRTKLLAATALALAAAVTPATADPILVATPDRVCPPPSSTVTLACIDLLAGVTAELSPSGNGTHQAFPRCTVARYGNQAVVRATIDTIAPAAQVYVLCRFDAPGIGGMLVNAAGPHTASAGETITVPAGATVRACLVSARATWSDGTEATADGCTPS